MLRVTTIYAASAASAAAYYTKYLAGSPGEVPGVWTGRQASALGLCGEVRGDDLHALLEGRDPVRGTPLGRLFADRIRTDGTVVRAVAGFDLPHDTPIEGLWNVGDAVKEYANGGPTACAETAKIVAEKIAAAFPRKLSEA